MQAQAPRADDLPDRPVFVNEDGFGKEDEKETEEKPAPVAASRQRPAGRAAAPTYRPAYVPPRPAQVLAAKKPAIEVDVSKVRAGTLVTHKAFGAGQVKGIDGAIIVVSFCGIDKRFQFPGAFSQGFLKLDEN